MKVVIQRSKKSMVLVFDNVVGKIDRG